MTFEKGGALLARGRIDSGGLAVGLLEGDRWYRRVEVTERGNFVAIVEADQPGTYVPVVAHAASRGRRDDRSTIFKIGAVARLPAPE